MKTTQKDIENVKAKLKEQSKESKEKNAKAKALKEKSQLEANKLNDKLQLLIKDYEKETGEKILMWYTSVDTDWYQKKITCSSSNLNEIDAMVLSNSLCWMILSKFQ